MLRIQANDRSGPEVVDLNEVIARPRLWDERQRPFFHCIGNFRCLVRLIPSYGCRCFVNFAVAFFVS
jgi:hypothetical protein